MTDPVIRPRNVAALLKLETTEGTDASPAAADAFPFEADDYSYNHPFTSEASNEATGSLVAGADLVVGQPARLRFRSRLKGANATYSSSVKPPLHALFSVCGKRGQFTAAIAAEALVGGGLTTADLGASYSSTVDNYIGQPLILTGDEAGRIPLITNYTSGKVATLTDRFSPALDTGSNAELPANWTYMGTSPRQSSERATDHPSGTLYLYEDGTVMKFLAVRGMITQISGEAGKPIFVTTELVGIFAGSFRTDAAIPSGLPNFAYGAPQLQKGPAGISNAVAIDETALPISRFTLSDNQETDSPADTNTAYGFGAGQIGGRRPLLSLDPLQTLVATRDALSAIAAQTQVKGVIRTSTAIAGNRAAITFPSLQPVDSQPGKRGMNRSDELKYRCISTERDAQTRDTDYAICLF